MTTVLDVLVPGLSIDRAVVERLGWTLLIFLWQGAAIAAGLALFDALFARHRATVRYTCACAALLAMLLAPMVTFAVLSSSAHHSAPRHLAGAPERSPRSPVALSSLGAPFRPAASITRSAPLPSMYNGRPGLGARFTPARLLPWLVAFWAVGVLMLSLRLLGGWWLVRRLSRSAEHAPLESWRASLDRLSHRIGVARSVRLVRSARVLVPTTIGWLRPMILLPASTLTGLAPSQIEAILAHELAHIRRHDYVVNLLQSLLETLLFYHPAVWWVSRRIRDERELCCDELAVEASGDPVLYARALVELERLRGEETQLALAATGGSLVDRIARLLGVSRRSHRLVPRGLAWALVAVVVLIGGAAGGAVRVNSHPLAAARAQAAQAAQAVTEAASVVVRIAPTVAATSAVTVVHQATALACAAASAVEATAADPQVACDKAPKAPCKGSEPNAPEGVDIAVEVPDVPDAPDAMGDEANPYSDEERQRIAQAGAGPRYVANLARNGYSNLSVDEVVTLAQHGVMSAYAGKMKRTFGEVSVAELVQLADHGVSSDYAAKMKRILGDVGPADLVLLADHGVSSAYTYALHENIGNIRVRDLVQLADHGVSSDYLKGLRDLGIQDLSTEDLIKLANSGVTLDYFDAMRWMGYRDLSVDRAIELHNSGITADYAASLRMLKKHPISLDELRTLRNQGVDVDYVAGMVRILHKDLDVEQLIRFRNEGVTVEYVAAMNALGRTDLSCDDLVTMHQQGIDPEYVATLAGAGYRDLDARDLVRLRQSGVDADFIESVRDAGFESPSVKELIRMRQSGIPEERSRP